VHCTTCPIHSIAYLLWIAFCVVYILLPAVAMTTSKWEMLEDTTTKQSNDDSGEDIDGA